MFYGEDDWTDGWNDDQFSFEKEEEEDKSENPAMLLEYLYIGDVHAAREKERLKALGITHILNVADDVESGDDDSFEILHIKIADGGEDYTIVDAFQTATEFVQCARSSNGCVLIHCWMGINRSTTVTLAVIMELEGWTLRQAYEHTKSRRKKASPFAGNKNKIALFEKHTRGECSMPDWITDASALQEVRARKPRPQYVPTNKSAVVGVVPAVVLFNRAHLPIQAIHKRYRGQRPK